AALAAQATTARTVATGRPAAPAIRSGLVVAAVTTLALCLASPVVSSVLQLSSPVPALPAAVAIGAFAAAVPRLGVVQGGERFGLLAALVTTQAMMRAGAGLVGMAVSPTATGAMIGAAAGLVLATGVACAATRPTVAGPQGYAVRPT